MNFTPIVYEETVFGGYDPTTNKSTGLINLLHEGIIDFSATFISLSTERSQVVDFAIVRQSGSKEMMLKIVFIRFTFLCCHKYLKGIENFELPKK